MPRKSPQLTFKDIEVPPPERLASAAATLAGPSAQPERLVEVLTDTRDAIIAGDNAVAALRRAARGEWATESVAVRLLSAQVRDFWPAWIQGRRTGTGRQGARLVLERRSAGEIFGAFGRALAAIEETEGAHHG